MKKNKLQNEFTEIASILSGEMELRKKQEEIEKLKKKAIEDKKADKRVKVASKELILEDSDIPTKKVVQNIKLFEWEAPDRAEFSLENKTYWIILVISLLFTIYLAILGQYFLMAAIIALLFFVYVIATNKPSTVVHKITARGIDTGGRLYEWFMLDNFWFSMKDGQYLLIVETKLRLPKALIILLDQADKDAIFVLLQEKVLYKDIRKQNWVDRMSYGDYIPFEEI